MKAYAQKEGDYNEITCGVEFSIKSESNRRLILLGQ